MKNPVAPTKAAIQKKGQPRSMKFLGGLAAEETYVADNMKEEPKLRDLNFKVDPEFHTKFKMTATAAGLSMKELLEDCFETWIRSRAAPK